MSDVEKVHKEATLFFGTIDVLVNNAGAAFAENRNDYAGKLERRYCPESDRTLHVDPSLPANMEAQGKGAITNISSVNGAQSFEPAYSAAKAGVISSLRPWQLNMVQKAFANVVLPGTIETPVWQTRKDSRPEVLS